MSLSEREQRMLEEIESALYAEDPQFVSSVRRSSSSATRVSAVWIALALGGLALLVVGLLDAVKISGFPILSVCGFLMMFVAGVMIMRSPGKTTDSDQSSGEDPVNVAPRRTSRERGSGDSFSDRMQQRFNNRFDER